MKSTKIYIVLIYKELLARRWNLLIYGLVAVGFLWLYVAMYPSLAKSQVDINQIYKSMPKSILQAFNINQTDFSFAGFLGSKHMDMMWPLMTILLGLGWAGNMLAGEIERGSMNLLLSLPIKRLQIYFSKFIAGKIGLTIYVFVSVALIIPLGKLYNVDINSHNVLQTALLCWFFAMSIFTFGLAVSAITSERGKTYFIAGGVLFAMYVARILSSLFDSLQSLKYISFFYYFNPSQTLVNGQLNRLSVIIFSSTITICFIIGLALFQKRDV